MRLLRSAWSLAMIFRVRQGKLPLILLCLVVFVVVVAVPVAARAQGSAEGAADAVAGVFNDIAPALTYAIVNWLLPLMGRLLTLLVSVLVWVSGYSDFINSVAVVNGWVIVRDIANMFFIIVLLIVAFGTILGQEEYHYKKLLPKLLMMAVLVNFSRTIVGVMIDAAQVVMLTFVNGYSAAAGGNFAAALQIKELLQFNKDTCGKFGGNALGPSQILIGATLALGMVVVSIITITVILAVLLLRIVVLWFLTVMSPMAFLLGTFPQGQKYYTQWWEEFQNQVIVGPVLAFFLWLSLVTVGSGNAYLQITNSVGGAPTTIDDKAFPAAACTDVAGASGITSFAIATLMLLAGTQMAQQMGGAISGVAGQAKNIAKKGLKFGLGMGLVAPAGFLEQKFQKMSGIGLNPMRYVEAFKAYSQRRKILDAAEGAAKAGASAAEIMAGKGRLAGVAGLVRLALGSPQDFFENYMGWRGAKRVGGILAGGSKKAEELRHLIYHKDKVTGEETGLSVTRGLYRTKEEQDKARKELTSLADSAVAQGARAAALENMATTGVMDLTDALGQERAMAQLSEIAKTMDKAKKAGDIGEANRLEEDQKKLSQALAGGNSAFNFAGLYTRGAFEESLKLLAKGAKDEIKKLDGKKIKLQAEIVKADAQGLVFNTGDKDKDKEAKLAAWKAMTEKINTIEQRAAFRTPPTAFYAAENFKHLEAEERKKMPKHGLEATEVIEQVQSAMVDKNKVKFMSWLKKATEDYNDNEIWNAFGYQGDAAGIEQFRKDIMVGKLGMTNQESMSHMSDINYMNEEKGHNAASRMYGVHNGVFYTKSAEEQAASVANEITKKQSRNFWQQTNRLGIGSEGPDGTYRIDPSGLATLVAMQDSFVDRYHKGEYNASMLGKMIEAIGQIEKLGEKGLLTYRHKDTGMGVLEVVKDYAKRSAIEGGSSYDKLVQVSKVILS